MLLDILHAAPKSFTFVVLLSDSLLGYNLEHLWILRPPRLHKYSLGRSRWPTVKQPSKYLEGNSVILKVLQSVLR